MMQKLLTATLLTAFLTSCSTIDVGPPSPPADKLVCALLPAQPDIEPLEAFQAQNGAMVYYKADVDARDAKIAPYIVNLRGAWFSCSSNLAWNKTYHENQ